MNQSTVPGLVIALVGGAAAGENTATRRFEVPSAWMGPASPLQVVLLSSPIGTLIGGNLIALRKHDRQLRMPFGPFVAAFWAWLVAGDQLLQGYLYIFNMAS
jgi:prepilin signal peptidase PulO-like enzyme (type II secretory pathway)